MDIENLVFVSLAKEAKRAIRNLNLKKEDIEKLKNKHDEKKVTEILSVIQKISYNVRAANDTFIEIFVNEKGIATLMDLIE
jgi:hypothetical protein